VVEERKARLVTPSEAEAIQNVASSTQAADISAPVAVQDYPAVAPGEEIAQLGNTEIGSPEDYAVDKDKLEFSAERGPDFTIDKLVLDGHVSDSVQIFPKLDVTFKSLDMDSIIRVERELYSDDIPVRTYMDLIAMRKMAIAISHINGRPIQDDDPGNNGEGKKAWEKTEMWLKAKARPLCNLLLKKHGEFEQDVDVLVTKENLKNS
jgi:hypothetical protein